MITFHTLCARLLAASLAVLTLFVSGAAGADTRYSYDSINRVTEVTYANASTISYTYDAAGNRLTYSGVVNGNGDTIAPSLSVVSPTSGTSFSTANSSIILSGIASDNVGISKVSWQNDSGQFGLASGGATWTIPNLPLRPGANTFTITARDEAGNTADATLTVTYSAGAEYSINVSASPNAGGIVTGNGTFTGGTAHTVTAVANSGYTFVSWTEGGSVVSTSANYLFTLNANRNLVANFASAETCDPVPSGLLAWWTGDVDGADLEAANNGVLNSVQFASGQVGNGFDLSGSGSFIEVPDNIPLHTPYALTLEMWIKPTDVNAYHYLFTKAGFNYKDWNIYLWKGGLHAEFLDASSTRNEDGVGLDTPDGVIAAGVFSHIALTMDTQTHVAEIFVNGVSVARNTFPTISNLRVTPGNIFIGSSTGGATGFQGIMDEVSLYRRALSADEIRAIYQAGAGGKCRPLANGVVFAGGTSGYHNTGGTTRSLPITVAGTNTILIVGWGHDGNGHVTSVTYDGVPMVSLGTQAFDTVNPQNFNVGMFYLLNPHHGTHDLVLTRDIPTSTMDYTVALYTGVDQTNPPEMVGKGATASLTDQPSATIVATCSACWVVGAVNVDKSIVFDSANLRLREQSPDQTTIFDSDGPVSAGSHTFSWKLTQPGHSGWMFATLTPVTENAATPTITPAGGTFVGLAQVTVACVTPGATIRYTTDGSDPAAGSPAYSTPLTLTTSATVKAKAFAQGYNDSAIASAAFTITPVLKTITATAGANGTIAPSGVTTKAVGESLTLTATPSQGFEVDRWLLDGTAVQTGGATFNVANIQANHTVQVTFRAAVIDLSSGLFAYYPFDGSLADSSGNGFDGVNYGAVADVDRNGTANSAIHFAGTANWAKLPIGSSRFSGDFSIALWLKLDDFVAQYPAIINGDTGFIRLEAAGPLYTGEGNYRKIKFYQLGQSQVWSGSTFDTGRWYHLTVVRAGTNYRIYVDGALSGQNDMPEVNVSGSYLQLGNDAQNTYGGAYFHGSLDELKFYSRALNASEVQALYSGAAATAATPLIAPNGGTFAGQVQVTLTSATPGATIRYTIDGSDPTTGSLLYTSAFTLTASATVKAKAFASGYGDSVVATAGFTLAPAGYTITANAGIHGAVTPSGSTIKSAGESITFTATPSQGYEIDGWTLDGSVVQTGGSTFTLSNIQVNHTVQVAFRSKLSDGLLAYYPFDGDLGDTSGNGFDGINLGAIWDVDRNGAVNSAIKFTGSGNWVKLPIGASNFAQEFSIALWLKLDDFAAQYPAIINGDTGFIRLEAAGPLYIGEGNYQKIKFYQLGQSQVWSGTTFDTGRWYHLAVVRSGTNYRIYVNGALSGENTMPDVPVSGNYLQVGNDALNTYGGAYFHGSLDDLRFYGQALSPAQVRDLFAGPPAFSHLNLAVITGGSLQCLLRGPARATVLVESSVDLVNWILERTHLVPAGGSMEITLLDQVGNAAGGKFYRARLPSSNSAFSDDFNRADSQTVGNGWVNAPSDGVYHLVVKDGRLSVDPNDPTETGAIVYHPMPQLPVTLAVKFTDKNGFGTLRNRYQSSVAVLYDPSTGKGYGLQLTRADQNYNDSKVTIWDGNTTVATVPCAFQFGTEITVNAAFKLDGSIEGTIQDAGNSFPFTVGPRAIESTGANVMIGLNRSGSGTILPTADDFSITTP